jgi:hypothetical protein
MTDMMSVIRAERESLERELQADPRYLKIQHLRELEALYAKDSDGGSPPAPQPTSVDGVVLSRGSGKIKRRIDPDRVRVLEQAANIVRGTKWPVKTTEIYVRLGDLKSVIRGNNPLSNLSAMLHHSPTFKSHGRSGWTLVGEEGAYDKPAGELELEDLENE